MWTTREDLAREVLLGEGLQILYRCAARRWGPSADAEDAAQDAFIALMNYLPREVKNLQALMCVAARTARADAIRSQTRRNDRELRAAAGSVTSETFEARFAEFSALDDCLDALDEELRVVLLLHDYDDLSTSQIAERLDIAEGTIRGRITRSRSKMRSCMESQL